jgi:transmembrane sensor
MNDYRNIPLPRELREGADEATVAARTAVWDLLPDADEAGEALVSDDLAWRDLERCLATRTAGSALARRGRPPLRAARRRAPLGLLVAMVLLAAVGGWWWFRAVTVAAAPGEIVQTTLPDGTDVTLNSGSAISYTRAIAFPNVVPGSRTVRLMGEALFEVRPGERPFVVETFNARVEVLGTRFNVRAWQHSRDQVTHVALLTGSVRVRDRSGAGEKVLDRPGTATMVSGIRVLEDDVAVLPEHATAWTQRGFIMADESVGAILDEVARRFDLRIRTGPDVDLSQKMSLFYPRGADAETILRDLCLARGLVYYRTSRGFSIE